ncbi:MAG TPA: biopolymer transporter ExbD [Opitutaceae bacterium]|jgi:biopolymer transport protein ExbD
MIGRKRGHGRVEATHIDMVPMVDCMMVLIIFLMISSAFVSDPGVEVHRPDVSGGVVGDQRAVLVAITRDDRIYFDGQEIQLDQLSDAVRRTALGKASVMIIRGDRSGSIGRFAAVYSEAKRAGIEHVEFATAKGP